MGAEKRWWNKIYGEHQGRQDRPSTTEEEFNLSPLLNSLLNPLLNPLTDNIPGTERAERNSKKNPNHDNQSEKITGLGDDDMIIFF